MDKESRRLVIEIIFFILLLAIVVPFCVNASNKYQERKDFLLSGFGTFVDITHDGDGKKVIIYNNCDDIAKVNLILKITKFSNDYVIYLDDKVYRISDLEYTEDDQFQYYNLGIYEVDQSREFNFKLMVEGNLYYDETITYSFITEGLL